jgi:hypothetical protein
MLPSYVWESISYDAQMFDCITRSIMNHPDGSLLILGLAPIVSRFVVESYDCLVAEIPELKGLFTADDIELVRKSRHRSKLLLNRDRDLTDITSELRHIAESQREAFIEPHRKRLLYGLINWLQPDLGLFRYEGKIFSTTHAVIFGFGDERDLKEKGRGFGYAVGRYVATLASFAKAVLKDEYRIPVLSGAVTMTDIKYKQMYSRAAIGRLELGFSAACALILANTNFVHRIIRECFCSELAFFKQKFLTAYHAQASLRLIQNVARPTGHFPAETAVVFEKLISDSFARWLKGKSDLRNTLTHYRVDTKLKVEAHTSYEEVVEHLLGSRNLSNVNSELDRYLDLLENELALGFRVDKNTFWYGAVK